jgi:hypothetical protein
MVGVDRDVGLTFQVCPNEADTRIRSRGHERHVALIAAVEAHA